MATIVGKTGKLPKVFLKLLKLLKFITPVLIFYICYLTIVNSNLSFIHQQEFYVTFNHLKSYLKSPQANSVVFVGPSTVASSVSPNLIYKDATNLSVYGISPVDIYTIVEKLVSVPKPPKCIIFNFNYNRNTYFSEIDPLKTLWPLFSNFYIPQHILDDYMLEYVKAYPDDPEFRYLQYYFRILTNNLRLTRYHLKLFFSFFKHNPLFRNADDNKVKQLNEELAETQGMVSKIESIKFYTNYNYQYVKKYFEANQLNDRYFIKIIELIKSKNIKPAFLFTPISLKSHRALKYNNAIFMHLRELLNKNGLSDSAQIIYKPKVFKKLTFIDLNHVDAKSGIAFSHSIKNNVISACDLE